MYHRNSVERGKYVEKWHVKMHCAETKKNVSHSEKKQENAASIKRAGLQSNFLKIMEQQQTAVAAWKKILDATHAA